MKFDEAFEKLIGHEGGYSNHPDDPGGETMHGVTAKIARANGYTGAMRDIPLSLAKSIYRASYWDAVEGWANFWASEAGLDGAVRRNGRDADPHTKDENPTKPQNAVIIKCRVLPIGGLVLGAFASCPEWSGPQMGQNHRITACSVPPSPTWS